MLQLLSNFWSFMISSPTNFILVTVLSVVFFVIAGIFLFPKLFLRNRIALALWGKFESVAELRKFGFLAAVFFLIIAVYWGMRPLKDGLFNAIVGMDWQPVAKWLSLVLITPLVILYSKLIDKYPRDKVFYVLLGMYAIATLLFMGVFMHPTIGLANKAASSTRIIGWMWYVFVESFGSLIVALFWAFSSDITKPAAAKRGFPIIYLFGQAGNILGPWALRAKRFGFGTSAPVVGIISVLIVLIMFLFWVFNKVTPKSQMEGYQAAEVADEKKVQEHKEEPGFLDGLKLLFSHGYLLGIVCIIMFFELVVTILDFFFKVTAAAHFAGNETGLSAYLADYGVWTGIVSTLCVLLGTSAIQRKLGMTFSLLLLPILVGVAVITLRISPVLGIAFWIMVLAKAANYALNQPTIKQLYIPTTKDTKYKAQAWIEMFGSRGSKALGSAINFSKKFVGINLFLLVSSTISLGLVGVWLFIAVYVARVFNKAVKENKVVC